MSTATEGGRAPESPRHLSRRDWLDAVKRSGRGFMADDCLGLSRQIAYGSLLAFFPSVVLLVGLLGLFNAFDELERFLGTVAPRAVIDAIDLARKNSQGKGGSAVAVIVGLTLAVWAASGAMSTVVKAVNRAYGRQETRPGWRVRLIGLVLVAMGGLVTAGVFLLIVFGGPIGDAIARRAHLGGAWDLTWGLVRWPLAFVVILLFLAFVYYLAPDVQLRNWKWISPGSLVGGLGWLALSALFALYTSLSSSYSATYGSLAGAIVLLLWLHYSAVALLFGAELNAELDRQASIRAAGGPRAGLTPPARRVSSS